MSNKSILERKKVCLFFTKEKIRRILNNYKVRGFHIVIDLKCIRKGNNKGKIMFLRILNCLN